MKDGWTDTLAHSTFGRCAGAGWLDSWRFFLMPLVSFTGGLPTKHSNKSCVVCIYDTHDTARSRVGWTRCE